MEEEIEIKNCKTWLEQMQNTLAATIQKLIDNDKTIISVTPLEYKLEFGRMTLTKAIIMFK